MGNTCGGRPLGFGVGRVRSLPDGVAQVLADHLSELPENKEAVAGEQLALPIGDLCPDCGERLSSMSKAAANVISAAIANV